METESSRSATSLGRDRVALRRRMERFARLRSAHRALPAAAIDLQEADERETRAHGLRAELQALADFEGPADELSERLSGAQESLDDQLDALEQDLTEQFDAVDIVALRATIPRSVETHRREVVALVESLLEDREALRERLPKVEYLITMLSTEEDGGRRKIVHDPVALTPMLTDFEVEDLDPMEADAVAVELYQIASLDADRENPLELLRSVRSRKEAIGLGCLSPNVLRAVITYNARMFNCVESVADASRASDESLEEILGAAVAAVEGRAEESSEGTLAESDEIWETIGSEGQASSVFESEGLDTLIDATRRRVRGIPVGSCTSERVALVLDLTHLDSIERQAFLADERDENQDLLVRTAVVGLLYRDLGAVRSQLAELGLSEWEISNAWTIELNDRLGALVAGMIGGGDDYELASIFSGLKTKHLLAAMTALKAERKRREGGDTIGHDDAAFEMNEVSREALAEAESGGFIRRGPAAAYQSLHKQWTIWPKGKRLAATAIALPLCLLLGFMSLNYVGTEKATVETLDHKDLADVSVFISSAYRSDHGKGSLLIGQLHPGYMRLSLEGKIEQAAEMRAGFRELGVSDVMIYDRTGALHIHITGDVIRKPRKAPERKAAVALESLPSEAQKRLKSGYAWRAEAKASDSDAAESPPGDESSSGAEGDSAGDDW